jgi:hypothetical protein
VKADEKNVKADERLARSRKNVLKYIIIIIDLLCESR